MLVNSPVTERINFARGTRFPEQLIADAQVIRGKLYVWNCLGDVKITTMKLKPLNRVPKAKWNKFYIACPGGLTVSWPEFEVRYNPFRESN